MAATDPCQLERFMTMTFMKNKDVDGFDVAKNSGAILSYLANRVRGQQDDQPQPDPNCPADMQKYFAPFDPDGDGKAGANELVNVLESAGNQSQNQDFITAMVDGLGTVVEGELTSVCDYGRLFNAVCREQNAEKFACDDIEKEVRGWVGSQVPAEEPEERKPVECFDGNLKYFALLDKNSDGKVDKKEFGAAWKAI